MARNDTQLLDDWRHQRDASAFHEIVQRHGAIVYASSLRVLGNATDAEDVTQECFRTLLDKSAGITGTLGAWLHKVAVNRSIDKIRHEQRRALREQTYYRERTTNASAEWNELEPIIDQCIAALPERYRQPLTAHYLSNRSQAEIARDLGVNASTVSRRIDHGVQLVREMLRNRGIAAPLLAITSFLLAQPSNAMPATTAASLAKVAIGGIKLTHGATLGGILVAKKVSLVIASAAAIIIGTGIFVWSFQYPSASAPPVASDELVVQLSNSLQELEPIATPPVTVAPAEPQAIPSSVATASVHGVVRQGGAPKSSVQVKLHSIETGESWVQETAADGQFAFSNHSSGDYLLRLEESGYMPEPEPLEFTLNPGQLKDDIVFNLVGIGTLTGTVTGGGAPIANANLIVRIIGWGKSFGERSIRTDKAGTYRIENILAGDHEFQAGMVFGEDQTIWSGNVVARIEADRETVVDLPFTGGDASLDAQIYINGEPAANQDIGLIAYDKNGNQVALMELTSDEAGQISVDGLTGEMLDIHAYIVRGGSTPVFAPIDRLRLQSDERIATDLEFELGTGKLQGTIEHIGEPARNRSIILAGRIAETDERGVYLIEDLPIGATTVNAELITPYGKIVNTSAKNIHVSEQESTHLDFLFPGGDSRVEGQVLTAEGVPIAARVIVGYLLGDGFQQFHIANTQADGSYYVDALPDGDIAIIPIFKNEDFADPPQVIHTRSQANNTIIQNFTAQ